MVKLTEVKSVSLSDKIVDSGNTVLSNCGAIEDPALVSDPDFVVNMIRDVVAGSGEEWSDVDSKTAERAMQYFSEYLDPGFSEVMSLKEFSRCMLTYALLGFDVHANQSVDNIQ